MTTGRAAPGVESLHPLSLYYLLDPEVLADPYPLYHRLRSEDPVHWDGFLNAWVVTRYLDVMNVLQSYSADRAPTPERLRLMGLSKLIPIAEVMIQQLIFMDPPSHTRLRNFMSKAFTPRRVENLRSHIQEIVDHLLLTVKELPKMDVVSDLADPLPCIVSTEMMGLPAKDHRRLKKWSVDFAEMLGNFQHNPDRVSQLLKTTEEMVAYFRSVISDAHGGLIGSLLDADIDGAHLNEEEVIANCILIMVASQETTTNLISNAILTLLRNPEELSRIRNMPGLVPAAIEEVLRYESPSHVTARIAPEDMMLNGRHISKGQAIIAVIGAANRDPERFDEPDRFDILRQDNRHLAFGWAGHFCFGASLARMEGQIAVETMLRRLPEFELGTEKLVWRNNQGLRGLAALPVTFC